MSKQLPDFFKTVLWSYKFSEISPDKDEKEIIINSLNYGRWQHVEWVVSYYGIDRIRKVIEQTPESEFRPAALALAKILFQVEHLKYASRSDKIREHATPLILAGKALY